MCSSLGLARGDRERRGTLQHVRTEGRQVESALSATRGRGQLVGVIEVCDDDLRAELFETGASRVGARTTARTG